MYVLKIYEDKKKPEIRQYAGELTEEVRQQWRRVLKFSRFKYELLSFEEVKKNTEREVKCQRQKR